MSDKGRSNDHHEVAARHGEAAGQQYPHITGFGSDTEEGFNELGI